MPRKKKEVKEEVEVKDEALVTKEETQEQKPKTSFEFSDDDIQDFKLWKKEREVKAQISTGSRDDDEIYRKWKEESRLVKGIFRCREPEGGNVSFFFRKYKWDETKRYEMYDGQMYEVPLAVARHLNENCNYPIHSHILGPDGQPTVDTRGKKKSRMNFESTEFAVA